MFADLGRSLLRRLPWRLTLVIGAYLIIATLLEQYHWQLDATTQQRNSLSPVTVALLERMPGKLEFVAYVGNDGRARNALSQLHENYRRHKPDIELSFVDPAAQPEDARQRGVRAGGELFITYGGAERRLQTVNEQTISNALQQLLRAGQRWLVFLTGHGERDPLGTAGHELGSLGNLLKQSGYSIFQHNLAAAAVVPDNTSVLVVASARSAYAPHEVTLILDYLDRGGNLLWLVEPNQYAGLRSLAGALDAQLIPGVVMDPAALQLRVGQLDFVLASDFSNAHPVTRQANNICVLPRAVGLLVEGGSWQTHSLVRSSSRTWSEVGEQNDAVMQTEHGDTQGPFNLVTALTRPRADGGEQRVIIAGDGDFLSNAYLDNGGNRELGINLVNWLSNDDLFIDLQRRPAADIELHLSTRALIGFALVFLVLIPVALASSGAIIRWRRHRR